MQIAKLQPAALPAFFINSHISRRASWRGSAQLLKAWARLFIVDFMSSEKILIQVPHDKGHAHFYDTIESFPGLQAGPSFEDREKYLRDTIRYQLLSTTPQQASRLVTLRECFRQPERTYVEFCLQTKLPGTSLSQAAQELGLRK